jgi:hypothetical protein
MIYKLGKRFKFIRVLYRKLTGKGLWGLMGEIQDYKPKKDEPKYETKDYEEFKKFTEQIFSEGLPKEFTYWDGKKWIRHKNT